MKWEGRRQSDNFEDRRGMGTAGKVAAGGGAIGLIFLLIQLFLGGDSQEITQAIQSQLENQGSARTSAELTPEEKKTGEFISTILADTEDIWSSLFKQSGSTYYAPKLVLFSGATDSGCGGAKGSSGPFYCPADRKVYMDMSFFNVMKEKFGAKGGDFAIAYVISHEIGHHVQNQLGILEKVQRAKQSLSEAEANKLQVAVELQADFFSGVWSHHDNKYLDAGDFEEAMNTAAAVGNDHMQKTMQGYTVPESYTHGTSAQRMFWFSKGFKSGDIKDGDTYSALLK
jgi:predicted metalloprotease